MTPYAINVFGDYKEGSFALLEQAGERARAALYFARFVGTKSFDGNLEHARWYLRAALSEFQSIFDLLDADFKLLGLSASWKRSEQLSQLKKDPIVGVLRKVRDFAVHSKVIVSEQKTFLVVPFNETVDEVVDLPAVVIAPLNRSSLKAARGKDELSFFSDEGLAVFNQYANTWPADMLIHIAVYRVSEFLVTFFSAHQKNFGRLSS